MKAPPTGKLARSGVAGLALAQAGVARIGRQARKITLGAQAQAGAQDKFEADLGRIMFRALNQLKGTALKVSQLLSAHADFLPAGVRAELAKGNYQVTPLNRALVHKVFRSEFGQAPEHLFATFDAQACAAASLGQVHYATLADGTAVAVKVQYPGIGSSINSDLRMLRSMLETLGPATGMMPPPALVDQMMAEVAHKLGEELDYEHEAGQLAWFRARVTLPGVVIPQPFPAQSSKRVLTMARLDGLHLDQWLATKPDQGARNHAGQLLLDWFFHSLFELGRVHADPHPGNFLFMPDGRLGLLDFGCTKEITPGFLAILSGAWNALLHGGSAQDVRLAYVALGVISKELGQEQFERELLPAMMPIVNWQLEPFRVSPFDFAHRSPVPVPDKDGAATLARFSSGMHPDLPYFDRAYMGIMHMLAAIGAQVVTQNRWIERTVTKD
ncbi:ABC1 kinase family protein [Massilia sp. TSP1-1-2]|uniref:ABC1 kinase family protein n=1 Tax=Massilia sp. TSP1-1-2 TaxID=2804649 RepID=UPI003CE8E01A